MNMQTVKTLNQLADLASDEIECRYPELPSVLESRNDLLASQLAGNEPLVIESIQLSQLGWITMGDLPRFLPVAVLDTGCDTDHKALLDSVTVTWSAFGDDGQDRNGHGTHVMGTICGLAPTGVQRFGALPGSTGHGSFKVLNDSGSGTERSIVAGLAAAASQGYRVINASLGGDSHMPMLERAIAEFTNAGGIFVCASGNNGRGTGPLSYPARYKGVISVGSVSASLFRSDFSNGGIGLTCYSFGQGILSSTPNNRYARLSGTSMACPLAAAMLSVYMVNRSERPVTDVAARYAAKPRIGNDPDSIGVVRLPKAAMPEPVSPPPPPRKTILKLSASDLLSDAKQKLTAFGLDAFEFTLTKPTGVAGMTADQLTAFAARSPEHAMLARILKEGSSWVDPQFDWTVLIPVILDLLKFWIERRNPLPRP